MNSEKLYFNFVQVNDLNNTSQQVSDMPIDLTNEDVVAEIKAAGFIPQSDVESIVREHNSALEANRNDILAQLQETKSKIKDYPLDKIAKLKDDARFQRVLDTGFDGYEKSIGGELSERLNATKSDFMFKEQQYLKTINEKEEAILKREARLKQSEIKRQVSMALAKMQDQVDPMAYDDILDYAQKTLDLDQDGRVIVMGKDGIPEQTSEGAKRELEWLQDMKKSKPFFFLGASGTRTGTSRSLDGLDTGNMSPAEKIRAARKSGRA